MRLWTIVANLSSAESAWSWSVSVPGPPCQETAFGRPLLQAIQ